MISKDLQPELLRNATAAKSLKLPDTQTPELSGEYALNNADAVECHTVGNESLF